jgi:hypothetical protein
LAQWQRFPLKSSVGDKFCKFAVKVTQITLTVAENAAELGLQAAEYSLKG